MNPSESQFEPARSTDRSASFEDFQRQYNTLQNLFHAALVAVILLSLGVSLFIFKQMRLLRSQLEEQRPGVSRLIADYQKNSEPVIRNFTSAMERFAATNRDFQPIMEKYRPLLKDFLTAPIPAAAPPTSALPVQSTNK